MSNPYQDPYGQRPPVNPYPHSYGGATSSYASWGARLGAYLLDYLLLVPFYVVAGIAEVASATRTTDATGAVTSEPSVGGLLVAAIAYFVAAGFVVWNQWIRQGRTGQSLGKKWVGIKVTRLDTGAPPGVGLNIGRSLAHILDALPCYLGFFWPLWDDKNQTWADKICSTVVVRA